MGNASRPLNPLVRIVNVLFIIGKKYKQHTKQNIKCIVIRENKYPLVQDSVATREQSRTQVHVRRSDWLVKQQNNNRTLERTHKGCRSRRQEQKYVGVELCEILRRKHSICTRAEAALCYSRLVTTQS